MKIYAIDSDERNMKLNRRIFMGNGVIAATTLATKDARLYGIRVQIT